MTRSRRRRLLRVTGLVALALVLAEGVGLLLVWRQHATYPDHWAARAAEPVPARAVRILAYGDSSAMGIGAWRPEDSLVGRVARYVGARTGRPVHVVNRSSGGGGVEDARRRVTGHDVQRADLVLVSVGSGDVGELTPKAFGRHLRALLRSLPADRTVLSGIPPRGGWRTYQHVLADVADDQGVRHADVAGAFLGARRPDMFAPDLVHVNSTGYRLWFQAFRPPVRSVIDRRP